MRRLCELGIAPRLLAEGTHQGSDFLVLEHVGDTSVSAEWLDTHLTDAGELMRRYHRDPELTSILRQTGGMNSEFSHSPLLDASVAQMESRLKSSVQFSNAWVRFQDLGAGLSQEAFVPTHGDPNFYNFLRPAERLLLVDWDGMRLDCSGRDVGPFLWWYAPPNHWPEFFDTYGECQPDAAIYWWAARASLRVALWFLKRGQPELAEPFITDFASASRQEENPRGSWTRHRHR